MISYFRKLRQRVLAQNNLGKYLKYAFGEIVLVVLGILIALSINTWNEDRKQNISEAEFIEGVKQDLIQDRAYIQTIIGLADEKIVVYQQVESDFEELYHSDRESLDSLISIYFVPQRTFYPIYGSFQAAVSGNEINNFRNKAFTSAVTQLYNSTYARLTDNAVATDQRWYYFTRVHSRIRRTGTLGEMTSAQSTAFLDNIYYHETGIEHYRNLLEGTLSEIDVLLESF